MTQDLNVSCCCGVQKISTVETCGVNSAHNVQVFDASAIHHYSIFSQPHNSSRRSHRDIKHLLEGRKVHRTEDIPAPSGHSHSSGDCYVLPMLLEYIRHKLWHTDRSSHAGPPPFRSSSYRYVIHRPSWFPYETCITAHLAGNNSRIQRGRPGEPS